ncbi:MAG TPA: hypothetical protein VHC20_05415 [Candidatus Paceibacterota bacterium]|nr:hypothetical protein [Candidatus Paceibacterota bacterium]
MPQTLPLPFDAADFLFAPKKLPDPELGLDGFLDRCNQKINQLVCRAWANGAFPSRTVLVQVLTKSPIAGQIDFRHPFILKKSEPKGTARRELLASFAHTTWHLMAREASSHSRMREFGDISRGAVILFTKKERNRRWPTSPWHTLHFGFRPAAWPGPLDSSDCSDAIEQPEFYAGFDLGEFSDAFTTFDVAKFIKRSRESHFASIINDRAAPSDWRAITTPAENAKEPQKIRKALRTNIEIDTDYRDRVSVLLRMGAIVLCAPQSFYIADGHPKNGIFDSGLTVLLSDDEAPSSADLARIYAVSHNISVFIASTYGLANMLAHESQMLASRNIVSMISHSLKNTLTKAPRDKQQFERLVRLEMIKLDAASVLFDSSVSHAKTILWDSAGFGSESVAATIKGGLFEGSDAIALSMQLLDGKRVDARFAALVIELCSNLRKHSRSGSVAVSVGKETTRRIDMHISGAASEKHVEELFSHLQSNKALERGKSLRGWNFILMLTRALSLSESLCLEIKFVTPSNEVAASIEGTCANQHVVTRQAILISPLPEELEMNIYFYSLSAIT